MIACVFVVQVLPIVFVYIFNMHRASIPHVRSDGISLYLARDTCSVPSVINIIITALSTSTQYNVHASLDEIGTTHTKEIQE